MTANPHPRLENLLGSVAQGIEDEVTAALEEATGVGGSGTAALLALGEFLGGANVGRLAEVLGVTHSGAVRLAAQLETAGLVERRVGSDRRQVELTLTATGRRAATRGRAARADVARQAVEGLSAKDAEQLERLLDQVVQGRVRERMRRRTEDGVGGAWWCRRCDFTACGRPEGRCPAQQAAADSL